MTFDILMPYLKGFHLTLAHHLPGRDGEGWKMKDLEIIGHLEVLREKGLVTEVEAASHLESEGLGGGAHPSEVRVVPRFLSCLKALSRFFAEAEPPKWMARRKKVTMIVYGFADASKSGLGATI